MDTKLSQFDLRCGYLATWQLFNKNVHHSELILHSFLYVVVVAVVQTLHSNESLGKALMFNPLCFILLHSIAQPLLYYVRLKRVRINCVS